MRHYLISTNKYVLVRYVSRSPPYPLFDPSSQQPSLTLGIL